MRQHNKQAILGLGVFSYCVVRGNWENECKTVSLAPQKGEQRGSAVHLQAFVSPVVKRTQPLHYAVWKEICLVTLGQRACEIHVYVCKLTGLLRNLPV